MSVLRLPTDMSESQLSGFEGVHGGSGFGARNLEGEVLLEFADFHSLVITNTCFTKVDVRRKLHMMTLVVTGL